MAIVVHKPIMNADTGRREVGLAAHKVYREGVVCEVIIDYVRKNGTLLYPDPMYIASQDVFLFPSQVIKGVKLHIVPIDAMQTARKEIQP
jgi:hypothetical protein